MRRITLRSQKRTAAICVPWFAGKYRRRFVMIERAEETTLSRPCLSGKGLPDGHANHLTNDCRAPSCFMRRLDAEKLGSTTFAFSYLHYRYVVLDPCRLPLT